MSQYKVFSKFDFKDWYFQITLHEKNSRKAAFTALGKLYEPRCVMQGLKNAVAQSSRVGQHLFGNLPGTAIFNDDLLIGGTDYEDCYKNTCEVLKIVEKHKIALKLSNANCLSKKCRFWDTLLKMAVLSRIQTDTRE